MKTILSIICLKKVKYSLILLILLFIYISISAISYANTISSAISDNVFRLHIIANSDSSEDQNLKLIVRDNLLSYMNSLCSETTSKKEAINIVKEHEEEFLEIAKQTIINQGYNYDVSIEIGNYNFPTKYYGDISLPSGYYDALRVKIGNASGQNWWCVMFPPLCFVNISSGIVPDESKETLKNTLSQEEYLIINNDSDSSIVKFKFKILELFNNIPLVTAKNKE